MIGLDVEFFDALPVARPHCDIDAATAPRLREQLVESIGNNVESIVLDLSGTRYMDSAGIDMLLRLNERLRESRARLLLVIPDSSQLLRLAELVGLTRAMPVCDSVEQAVSWCGQHSHALRDAGATARS